MISLFTLSSTEGWVKIMWEGVDAIAIDTQPTKNASKAWALYYILFEILGGFFFINLFAGIVVDSFNEEKDKLGGNKLLTFE